MELDEIYEPVRGDLDRVEKTLQSVSRAELGWLPREFASGISEVGRVSELLSRALAPGGKRLRPALVLLSGKFFDYNLKQLLPMATAVEIMHLATLVHDDAIDNSSLRHGRPTINSLFSDNAAILVGDYLVAKSGELALLTGNSEVVKRLYQTLMTIASGELAQAFNAFNLEQSKKYYMHRIASKTASLLSLACECGALLSHAPIKAVEALKDYGFNIGIAFQIIDDVLDYVGTVEELGKPVGSDLGEGTITLPLLLYMEHHPDERVVYDILENRNRKENTEKVKELIRDSPEIILQCYRMAADYREMACESLMELPAIPSRDSLVELAAFIVERRR